MRGAGSLEGSKESSLQQDKNRSDTKCFQVWGLFRVRLNFRFVAKSKEGVHLILGYVRKPLILGSEVGVPYTWVRLTLG